MPRYKIKVDGVVFSAQRATGVGVLFWDSHGQIIAALSKKINYPLGALEAEVKAFEEGFHFAKDVGVHDFIIEGDSLLMFNALCGVSPPSSSVASLVSKMLMMCADFNRVNFSHIRRQGNRLAHLLAKHALDVVEFSTWIEENPCFLVQSLVHDVSFNFD